MVKPRCGRIPPFFVESAYIRVKVDGGMNVTLVGWADPGDKTRLEAAVVRIQNLPLVKTVENHVMYQKLG